jgi:hypothetical protein
VPLVDELENLAAVGARHRRCLQADAVIGLVGDFWTAELVAEAERRMAVDDADLPDSTAWMLDFALRVLDKLNVVEPYGGPGEHHW